jgi:hypothetical protein
MLSFTEIVWKYYKKVLKDEAELEYYKKVLKNEAQGSARPHKLRKTVFSSDIIPTPAMNKLPSVEHVYYMSKRLKLQWLEKIKTTYESMSQEELHKAKYCVEEIVSYNWDSRFDTSAFATLYNDIALQIQRTFPRK